MCFSWFSLRERSHAEWCQRRYEKALSRVYYPFFEYSHEKLEQEEWLGKYKNEEKHGIAILHRQHRLQEKQTALQQKNDGAPPDYNEATSRLDDEIKKLKVEYSNHRIRLQGQSKKIPPGPLTSEAMVHRRYRNEDNRPYSWVISQWTCADIGGCCARSCGCCKEALSEYMQPSLYGESAAVVGVYGHCTAECACCIQHQGFYQPDKRLPDTVLADQSA